jgi:FtsZ-interacting cell division protein ZipA
MDARQKRILIIVIIVIVAIVLLSALFREWRERGSHASSYLDDADKHRVNDRTDKRRQQSRQDLQSADWSRHETRVCPCKKPAPEVETDEVIGAK